MHQRFRIVVVAAALAVALTLASTGAARPQRQAKGSVNIGLSTTLSGAIAALGQGGLQGITLAIEEQNKKGGVLGNTINLVSADDNATPATGAANVRSMILDKNIVALFGPVSSGVATAELQLADQYKIPTFLHTSNDITLMTKRYTPYAFQVVPNTVMEPRAVAAYLVKKVKDRTLNVGTFAPDYVFGRNTVGNFLQALKDQGVKANVVNQQWPALGAPNIGPELAALISSKPEVTFNAQFGGDLVNFTNQAAGYGFFKKTRIVAMYSLDPLKALGDAAPSYGIAFDRAPYWGYTNKEMKSFVTRYKKRFNDYPSEWAIMAYSAVQTWVAGAQKAKSLTGESISASLPGTTVKTIRGAIQIRQCDHQAQVPEFVGTISPKVDKKLGYKPWNPEIYRAPAAKLMITCQESLDRRNS